LSTGGPLGELLESIKNYGPWGVLALALFSNLIPGFPAVYLTIVVSYAAVEKDNVTGLLAMILAGGLGAGIGKFVEFYLSDVLSSRVKRIESKRRALKRILARTTWEMALLVFLFAALPLPDDVLYIPLGAAGYNKLVFLASVTLGKIVLTALVAGIGAFLGWLTTENMALSVAAIVAGTIILLALLFAVDWESVLEGYEERGWRGAVNALCKELSRLLNSTLRRGR